MDQVCILGSTGSIGESTLEVIACNLDRYKVHTLVAHTNYRRLWEQIKLFEPEVVVLSDDVAAGCLATLVRESGRKTTVLFGTQSIIDIAGDSATNIVVAAIVGAAGLLPTLSAIEAGKKVLLANKESLVMAGQFFMDKLKCSSAILLPIDSEHNAIFQCLPHCKYQKGLWEVGVRRIILTASGGPFLNYSRESMATITPEQACAHPTWRMGKKISVDSATMMNKGLEIIEAFWLFKAKPEQLEVVIHPQSIIHSLVEYLDGSVLAQMATPDMKVPIAQALAWPQRIESGAKSLSLAEIGQLSFQTLDDHIFPCLQLAQKALNAGGMAAIVLNAANEVAVEAFLDNRLNFARIHEVIGETMQLMPMYQPTSVEDILHIDKCARSKAQDCIRTIYHRKVDTLVYTRAAPMEMDLEM